MPYVAAKTFYLYNRRYVAGDEVKTDRMSVEKVNGLLKLGRIREVDAEPEQAKAKPTTSTKSDETATEVDEGSASTSRIWG